MQTITDAVRALIGRAPPEPDDSYARSNLDVRAAAWTAVRGYDRIGEISKKIIERGRAP